MITPIDIALLGVVLATVALVILRRRRSGSTDAGAFRRAPREARERMLALVPFRDAGVRARRYGVEVARDLVAQARTSVAAHPGRALALLDQAEDIAPSLSAITEVRAEAAGR